MAKKTFRQHLLGVLLAFEGMAVALAVGMVFGAVLRHYTGLPPYSVFDWVIIAVVFLIGLTKPVTTEKAKHEKR